MAGDSGSITLDATSVRLAPLWINEQNSWQVTLVKVEMKDQELHKVALFLSRWFIFSSLTVILLYTFVQYFHVVNNLLL